ncbi:MAG: META domain-containing protein [Methylicorpusculum sp.]|nr:META domain-containing protein [Methylicorpusculum sp.]
MKRLMIFVLFNLLVGCAAQSDKTASDATQGQEEAKSFDLEASEWQLKQFVNSNGLVIPVQEGTAIEMVFANGKLSGSGGCNRYFGSYKLDDETGLSVVNPMGATMMACSQTINEQERRYFDFLAKVDRYQLGENSQSLVLLNKEGKALLVFDALVPSALEHTPWQATGINNGRGGIVSDKNTHLAKATFADGLVQGKAGCNRFSAAYTAESGNLSIAAVKTTRMACAEEGIMALEANYLKALAQAVQYEIKGDQLRLLDKEGSLLISFIRQTQ